MMKIYSILLAGVLVCCIGNGCFGKKEDPAVLTEQAEKAAVQGDWTKAMDLSTRAVHADPSNVKALVLRAFACENTGNSNEALEEISKAAAIRPNSFLIQYTRGRLLYERERYESCIAPLKEAHRIRPNNADALILLAQVSVRQKNVRDSQLYYGQLAKHRSFAANPAPWSEIGINLLESKNVKKAYEYFAYAVKLAPSNPTVVLNMAVMLDRYYRQQAKSRPYYLKYLSLTNHDSSLAAERAKVEARLKKLPAK